MKSFLKAVILKSAFNIGFIALAAGFRYLLAYFRLDVFVDQNLIWAVLGLLIFFAFAYGIRSVLEERLDNPPAKESFFSTKALTRIKTIAGYGVSLSIVIAFVLLFYLFGPSQLKPFLIFVAVTLVFNTIIYFRDALKGKSVTEN